MYGIPVPKPLTNHCLVAASVVAEIVYQEYVNAIPLYRQEAAHKQLGAGRKNWLFSDTAKGARASTVIYSLLETAGANDLLERGYLHIVLSNLPSMDFRQHPELLKNLMSWGDSMHSCFEWQKRTILGLSPDKKTLVLAERFAP